MSTNLTLIPGSLATGYCYPASPQTLLNDFMDLSYAVFGGDFQTFVLGSATPAAADQDKPWFRIVNNRLEGIYKYDSGYWLRPHPVPASSNYRALWVGTTTELLTFDGGANEAVGANGITGPMWEEDTAFAAKSPMGVGTLSGAGTNVTVANNFGAERVTLTASEVPAHTHTISAKTGLDIDEATDKSRTLFGEGETDPAEFSSERPTGSYGSGNPFSIVHPVRGCYIIKRTARVHYRI